MRLCALAFLLTAAATFVGGVSAFEYAESFDGHADVAAAESAGWYLVTDTDAPVSVSGAFSQDNDFNVAKITRANDATSLFSSAYFFHEHDIAPGETTPPGTLYGQDAGDFLMTTAAPRSDFGAATIDLRGARFHVDQQHGHGFYFAIVLGDGKRLVIDEIFSPPSASSVATTSSDPITTAT